MLIILIIATSYSMTRCTELKCSMYNMECTMDIDMVVCNILFAMGKGSL